MNLRLQRETTRGESIPGTLAVDGVYECVTLERVMVAIPVGSYPVEVTFSNHLRREAPLVDNVPDRTGIRIHSGNKPEDSEGCPLVGVTRTSDGEGLAYPAHPAEEALTSKIRSAIARGECVTLEVVEIPLAETRQTVIPAPAIRPSSEAHPILDMFQRLVSQLLPH